MAPSPRSAGAWSFTANNVASPFTCTPGTPAGKAVGDLLLLVCESRSITATVATPSGWNLVAGFPVRSGTASGGTIYVFTRIADGTAADTPSPVWTGQTTGTSGDSSGAGILAIDNALETLDAGTVIVADLSAQTTTATLGTFSTVSNNSIAVLVAMKVLESSGQTSTQNITTELSDNSTTSGTGHIVCSGTKVQGAHGSIGTAQVTWSATTSARVFGVILAFIQAPVVIALADTGCTITDDPLPLTGLQLADDGLDLTDTVSLLVAPEIDDVACTITDSILATTGGGGTVFPVTAADRGIGFVPVVFGPLG